MARSTDKTVTLTATFTYKTLEEIKTYQVKVLKKNMFLMIMRDTMRQHQEKLERKLALHSIISGHILIVIVV